MCFVSINVETKRSCYFKSLIKDNNVQIRTIRATGMAYMGDPIDCTSYIIIKEKDAGYEVEEILVAFNRDKMLKSIDRSTIPDKRPLNMYVARTR